MRAWLALLFWLTGALAATAQDEVTSDPPLVISPPLSGPVVDAPVQVLILDTERLFAQSRYAQDLRAAIDAQAAELNAENDRIVATLTEEEQDLTQRRPTMTNEAFRAEADAFNERVSRIRVEQDAKESALQDRIARGREAFLAAATPILGRLMLEAGAAVLLERRDVFLGVGLVDITERAVSEIDAEIGDGQQ